MNRSHLAVLGLCLSGCGVRVIGQLGPDELSAGAAGMSGSGAASTAGSGGAAGVAGGAVTNGGAQVAGAASVAGMSAVTAGAQAGGAESGGAGGADAGGEGGEPPELTAIPIAHYKLDDCTGDDVIDSQSSTLGKRIGAGCANGVLGMAANFDLGPSAQLIELAEEPRFDFTHELTVAAWIKPRDVPAMGAIVGKWYGQDSFLLNVREVLDQDGNPSPRYAFSIAEPEGTWGRPADVISPFEVEYNVWTHVAGVYKWSADARVGHITLYVNGKAVADTSTKVGTDGLQQSLKPVTIGFVEEYAPFVGVIDEVRLYDVALGPELAWLYRDPSHP
jgi:hypothetical protein